MVFSDSLAGWITGSFALPDDEIHHQNNNQVVKQTPITQQTPTSEPEIALRQSREDETAEFTDVEKTNNLQDDAALGQREEAAKHPTEHKMANEQEVAAADNRHMAATPTTSNAPKASNPMVGPVVSKLECDYDLNPTVLYQAIEAKQWEYAVNFMKNDTSVGAAQANEIPPSEEAATWVVRKEANGKLRWRLLPLHAAVIFGAPPALVELLLLEYPSSAQCKDDQGMLPLHLAFRNEAHWEVVEELLTAYPQALFVKDRKGRTPLQCGAAAAHRSVVSAPSLATPSNIGLGSSSVATGAVSNASYDDNNPLEVEQARTLLRQQHRQSFRTVVGVMELYTQICVSEERQRAMTESRQSLESRVGQLQDAHLNTLTSLKKEWQTQREESKQKVHTLQDDNRALKKKCLDAETNLSVTKASLKSAEEELAEVKAALAIANTKTSEVSNQRLEYYQKQNVTMRNMLEDLVQQQKAYHAHFDDLMSKYDKLMDERRKIMGVFAQQTSVQAEREKKVVAGFKQWLADRAKALDTHASNLEEEKKYDDVLDFVGRTIAASEVQPEAVAVSPAKKNVSASGATVKGGHASSRAKATPVIDLSDADPAAENNF